MKYKCKTCKDTKRIPKPMPKEPHPCNYVNLKRAERTISCPDCRKECAKCKEQKDEIKVLKRRIKEYQKKEAEGYVSTQLLD